MPRILGTIEVRTQGLSSLSLGHIIETVNSHLPVEQARKLHQARFYVDPNGAVLVRFFDVFIETGGSYTPQRWCEDVLSDLKMRLGGLQAQSVELSYLVLDPNTYHLASTVHTARKE